MGLNASKHRRKGRGRFARTVQVSLFAGTVQVDGDGIYYSTVGSVEDRPHTVVFLHGGGASSQVWNDQLSAMAADAYALTLDLPGHGRSEGAGLTSVQEYAAFVERFLNALGLYHSVVLVGHGLGAAVALAVAGRRGERIAGLYLLGLAPQFSLSTALLAAAQRGDDCESFWLQQFAPPGRGEVGRQTVGLWQKTRPEVRYGDLLAMQAFAGRRWAADVSVPTLVQVGSEDSIAPSEAARWFMQWIPAVSVEDVPGAGHMLMLEDPDACYQALSRFLAGLPLVGRRRIPY